MNIEERLVEVMAELLAEVHEMRKDISGMRTDITDLRKDVSGMRIDISDLKKSRPKQIWRYRN